MIVIFFSYGELFLEEQTYSFLERFSIFCEFFLLLWNWRAKFRFAELLDTPWHRVLVLSTQDHDLGIHSYDYQIVMDLAGAQERFGMGGLRYEFDSVQFSTYAYLLKPRKRT